MKLIAGLGNPIEKYFGTRHNLGSRVILAVAEHLGLALSRHAWDAAWQSSLRLGERIILARPTIYMNQSGQSIAAMVNYFHLPLEKVLIVVDDFNLPLGQLRFRAQGSAGGHLGLQSVIDHVGQDTFHRLRIGIDPPPAHLVVTDYVLSTFTPTEIPLIDSAVEKAIGAVLVWIDKGIESAMKEYNS